MDKYIKYALIANHASLGFHWIYDSSYLEALSLKQSLLFQKQDKKHYDAAKPSYYVYPNQDYTVQGMILTWLYEALLKDENFNKDDYANLLFEKLKPGGAYVGYVESYTKKLIMQKLSMDVKVAIESFDLVDDHLVGFVPYLVCKELNLGNQKAWDLAQLFTTIDDYRMFYDMFDHIFEHLTTAPIQDVLRNAIQKAPKKYVNQLHKAIEMDDTQAFIRDYAGIACQIRQSVPLIIHILAHAQSFKEMLDLNTKIGGASSDRGLILGAFFHYIHDDINP